MRLVVEDHAVTDTDGDLANHMHQVHHWPLVGVHRSTDEELDLLHADDHDDLRRGCG
jgi:hypothetical protein